MKKRIISLTICLLLIFVVVSPLSAFDVGGQLDTVLSFGGRNWFNDDFSGAIGLSEKATAWFRTPLPLGTLSIESSWTFNLSYAFVWPLTLVDAQIFSIGNKLDVSLVKYNLPIPIGSNPLDINVGRFAVADLTGLILNQNIDGLYATLPFKYFSVSAGAGYTGLQNAKTTKVYGISVTPEESSIYEFAPGYVAVLARIKAPNLIGGQSFDAEVNMFINCNTVEETDQLTRSYVTVGAHGSIIPLLYYNATFTGGFALGPEPKIGMMGNAGLSFYPNFLSSSLTVSTLFATSNFLPFTDIPLSVDGKIGCSDLLKLAVAISMKPVDKWLANLEAALLYSSGEDASFVLDVIQGNLSIKFQWFSDVCIIATNGLVMPVDDASVSYFTGALRAQISF